MTLDALTRLAVTLIIVIMTVPEHALWVALVAVLMIHQVSLLTAVAFASVPAVVIAEWWLARLQGRRTIRCRTDLASATTTVLETF